MWGLVAAASEPCRSGLDWLVESRSAGHGAPEMAAGSRKALWEAAGAVPAVPGRPGACATAARKHQQPLQMPRKTLQGPRKASSAPQGCEMMARKRQLRCHTVGYVKFLQGNRCSTGKSVRTSTPNRTGKQCDQPTGFPTCFLLRFSAPSSLCLPLQPAFQRMLLPVPPACQNSPSATPPLLLSLE